MKVAHTLAALALLTASFDVILTFNLVGNLRFSQIMLIGLILCAFAKIIQERKLLWPRGGSAIALWCIFQGLLLSQTTVFLGSLIFYLVMIFTLLGVCAFLQIYGRSLMIGRLMQVYLFSFVFVAAFGAIQFVSPILHLGEPLAAQWIVFNLIPRISGFSYEPSYFATYLVLGWIMLMDLRWSKAEITRGRRWFWALLLISAVMFLSTSKTAWLLMIGEGLARSAPNLRRMASRQIARLTGGRLLITLPGFPTIFWGGVAFFASCVLLIVVAHVVNLNIFLSGTGINGTAAHSLNDRIGGFVYTLMVVKQHFWIGRSLGGVPAAVAELLGRHATTFSELKSYWGFPVPLDVFAASGFWAFIPFLWFFVTITHGERQLIKDHWDDERAKWLRAVIRALIFEWLALCADQNLLRLYLWLHVAIVVAIGYNLRYFHPQKSFDRQPMIVA